MEIQRVFKSNQTTEASNEFKKLGSDTTDTVWLISYTTKTKAVVSGVTVDNEEINSIIAVFTEAEVESYTTLEGLESLIRYIKDKTNEKQPIARIVALSQLK